jgi:hypothetical protein
MESLLVGVTIISLLLAVTMSAIAWSLWQADRERTAARAEALEALAFADDVEERAIAPSPAMHAPAAPRTRPHAHTRAPQPPPAPASTDDAAAAMLDETPSDEGWDYALGGTRMDDGDLAPRARHGAPLPEELFHAAPASGAAGRLWLALAAVALVVTAGVVTYRAVHSPEIRAVVSSAAGPRATQSTSVENVSGAHALELLSLRHGTDADGAFTVMGLVQNPPDGESLDQIEAVVYLFDDDGRYFASGKAPLEVPVIAPGDESPFSIKVATTSGVSRYRVGFRRADGHVLAHVDRRGRLPGGTSGDAIDAQPALATPADAIRRAEGALVR